MRMRPKYLSALAALCGATLTLTSCSTVPDYEPGLIKGKEGARAVVDTFIKALVEGNGGRACSLIDRAAQERLMKATKSEDCLAAVRKWPSQFSERPEYSKSDIAVDDQKTKGTATLPNGQAVPPLAPDGVFHLDHSGLRWGIEG